MMNASKSLILSLLAASALLNGVSAFAATTGIENQLWQVKKVNVDTETERTLNYQFNDDRLVGRFIQFDQDSIKSDLPGGISCVQPNYTVSNKSLDQYIKSALPEGESYNATRYDLDTQGSQNTQAIAVSCKKGDFITGDAGSAVMIDLVKPQKIYMNWTDGTFLELSPVDKLSITPSFNCPKAGSATEKTICSDYTLSAWDRSVANGWSAAKQSARTTGNSVQEKKLVTSQKIWLQQRNACGSDKDCLKKSMSDRLDALSIMAD